MQSTNFEYGLPYLAVCHFTVLIFKVVICCCFQVCTSNKLLMIGRKTESCETYFRSHFILKCPYYGFFLNTFHAVCNTALSERKHPA